MRSNTVLAKKPPAQVTPMKYEALLAGLGDRDRGSLERQISAYEAKCGAASAERWRRLACVLRSLAPGPAKLGGSNSMQFFIPDGKYRKQVFALQALSTGEIAVYVPDVLAEAIAHGILVEGKRDQTSNTYRLSETPDLLAIDALSAKTPNPDLFYKDMTGWNRKALRLTLPSRPSDAQIKAVEQICALAARAWPAAQ